MYIVICENYVKYTVTSIRKTFERNFPKNYHFIKINIKNNREGGLVRKGCNAISLLL